MFLHNNYRRLWAALAFIGWGGFASTWSLSVKMASRKHVRYNFDVTFGTQEEKDAFLDRLKTVRQLLTPPDCPTVDNNRLFKAMFDAVKENHQQEPSIGSNVNERSTKSFLHNNGKNYNSNVIN